MTERIEGMLINRERVVAPIERGEFLRRISGGVTANRDAFAVAESRNAGKPIGAALGVVGSIEPWNFPLLGCAHRGSVRRYETQWRSGAVAWGGSKKWPSLLSVHRPARPVWSTGR